MSILDKLEQVGESLYSKLWYRVLILVGIIIITAWVSVWAHEFAHYWWAKNILHDEGAYIEFGMSGLTGQTIVTRESFGLLLAGGLFSGLVLFVLWIFVASFPNKLTLPVDMSLFMWSIYQLVYGVFEGFGYYFDYNTMAKMGSIVAIIFEVFLVAVVYVNRLIKYIKGEDDVDNSRNIE